MQQYQHFLAAFWIAVALVGGIIKSESLGERYDLVPGTMTDQFFGCSGGNKFNSSSIRYERQAETAFLLDEV